MPQPTARCYIVLRRGCHDERDNLATSDEGRQRLVIEWTTDLLSSARSVARGLVDDERLLVAGAVGVEPACGAVARRGARHRKESRAAALVEGSVPGTSMAACQVPFTSPAMNACPWPELSA
jgi:hypothetical protein